MNHKSKNWLIVVAIVVVVIIVFWLSYRNNSNYSGQPTATPSGATATPTASVKSGAKPSGGSSSGSTSYEQAKVQYAASQIQFNDVCQATSTLQVIKIGSKLLLDNRSKYAQTIKLADATYKLPAYGWQIITVTTKQALPYNTTVSCTSSNGSTVNNLVLRIQANILQGI